MENAMEFVSENIAAVCAAIVVLASVVNRLTVHWSVTSGPAWYKIALLVIEFAALLKSKEVGSGISAIKAPLCSARPGEPARGIPSASALLVLATAGFIFAQVSCAASWGNVSRTSLDAAEAAVGVAWKARLADKTKECIALADRCAKTKQQETCEDFAVCKSDVIRWGNAVVKFYEGSAIARNAIADAETAAGKWERLDRKARAQSIVSAVLGIASQIAGMLGVSK
jgi:hypothetical protein